MVTRSPFSSQIASFLLCVLALFHGSNSLLMAESNLQSASDPITRTVVAEVLEVEGDFHIVRGERGEIRIEVTPDTQISEEFTFGDRIKAVLLPNDVAKIITRASPDEPIGTTLNEPLEATPPTPSPTETTQISEQGHEVTSPLYQAYQVPKVRVAIANILMVDGSFYIIRSEQGEIQIEITPETKLSEDFKFDDKIKARITPDDKALSVVRAGKEDVPGIHEEALSQPTPSLPISQSIDNTTIPSETQETSDSQAPTNRLIVADVLMVDGDFYIVRGETGEIRIEVTPKTTISESFDYGDRIKAEVLPNDKALTIERASPDDPLGITTP